MKRVLAFDFGASGGRAILGSFREGRITLEEVHRFSNDPVQVTGTFYWDVLRLYYEIKQGILKAKAAGGFDSIGIDTWGVDFGLLDQNGKLLSNPVHYRDARTRGVIGDSEKYMSNDDLYRISGIQFMEFNTVFQLMRLKETDPAQLENAASLLFMPDLLSYFLTGKKACEYSIATTSGMVDIQKRDWSAEVISAFGLPEKIFGSIIKPGTVIGTVQKALAEELGIPEVPVIAVCGHDTQSAITAVPTQEKDFAFISSGTWSLFGTEPDAPAAGEKSRLCNFTNEGGFDYATAFLKNICGLWLIQESRRQWRREGKEFSFAALEEAAAKAAPLVSFIDPDSPDFVQPGDLPGRIRAFCERTHQPVPATEGEIVRCIYESLALKYRHVFAQMQYCTGGSYRKIHVVGGGTQDQTLCRMTAHACGVPVYAGPTEATVLGNVSVQLIALGELSGVSEGRRAIAESFTPAEYLPAEGEAWAEAYERFREIIDGI